MKNRNISNYNNDDTMIIKTRKLNVKERLTELKVYLWRRYVCIL
jgi:hypothetical protein